MVALILLLIIAIISEMTVFWLAIHGELERGIGSFAIVLGYVTIAICAAISFMSPFSKGGASGRTPEHGDSEQSSSRSEPNGSTENDLIP